jgi:NAD(P)-dependent dehydrogenase (short-subunit alcohol dehydrogenase family)
VQELGGARVVVIGGSSGLGRSIGVGLAQRGGRVALLARRAQRVADAAAEAGNGAIGLACDVRDEVGCAAALDAAAEQLGGIDGLVYCAGVGPLRRLRDADAGLWRDVFDTNVIGAAITTRAALPHLQASRGRAAYLSSVSASFTRPWPGLGVYATSKAALDKLVEAWRAEHPDIGFTRLVVGDSAGGDGPCATEFANGWDPELAAECFPRWMQLGYMNGGLVDVGALVRVVVTILATDADVPSLTVTPRAPAEAVDRA